MDQQELNIVNVLFTSVGRRVELMRAFRCAFDASGTQGQIVAVDIDPLAPALTEVDVPSIVPRLDDPAYVSALRRIIREQAISAVFPLIDPDIHVLAENRSTLEATGARLMVIPRQAAAITGDKWLTSQFFDELGLATPRSFLPDEIDRVTEIDFPLFIKPRRGSASQDTFRVRDLEELNFFSNYVPEPIIQEYLPGPEITNDVACDLDGNIMGVVSRQRIEVRGGEVTKGKTIYDRRIVEGCFRVAKGLSAIGPITVQCMMVDGVPYFTEINARYGGGAPLGFRAGADSPFWYIAMLSGKHYDLPEIGSYDLGLHMSRFDDTHFLGASDIERMAARRI